MPSRAQLPQFYAGRSIFITGATGFMGKVLVERLLATCPDVGRLYLLMRSKKGVVPENRLVQLKESQVFDVIRKTDPHQLGKLSIIPGDTALPQLGMSHESLTVLREVSIVFHSAATLKFNEALPNAVDQNLRSVMRLMDICDQLPNVQAFIYVSTGFSNAELQHIEERVYPPPAPVAQVLALVDHVPAHVLEDFTDKYISPKPNMYTFTKAMAETAVERHGARGYGVAIVRPTAVVSAIRHPHPGWIENFNGPSGVLVSVGNGALRAFGARPSARADVLPVDLAIDTFIAVAWEIASDRPQEVRVYNCSTYENPITWGDMRSNVVDELRRYPINYALWYPFLILTDNRFAVRFLQIMLHTLPYYLAEYATKLLGTKKQLNFMKLHQKLHTMTNVLRYFTLHEWSFDTSNVQRLMERLSKEDREIYNLDTMSIDWRQHNRDFARGLRRYMMGQKDDTLPEARRHLSRLKYLHEGAKCLLLLVLFALLFQSQFVQDLVYGVIRLLTSLFDKAYAYITT